MRNANFMCPGRFCSKRKMCLYYKKNIDLLEFKPDRTIDQSMHFTMKQNASGHLAFNFEYSCGDTTSFSHFKLIANSNKGSEAND